VTPSQLELGRWPGPPTLHPDGTSVVVAVRRIDFAADDYASELWEIPTGSGELTGAGGPRQLTYGWQDTAPSYSPDGAHLCFLRSTRDGRGEVGKPQLWVMPTIGGEARRVTDAPGGVEQPAWSPDSTRLAYLVRDVAPGRGADVDPDKQPPRRITTRTYRLDGVGFLDSPRQIWITGLDQVAQAITDGDVDHESVGWHPAGTLLTFVVAAHAGRRDDLRSDVWVCQPDGTGRRPLTQGSHEAGSAQFSADGQAVVFTGTLLHSDGRGTVARNTSLWSVPVESTAPPIRLTDQDRHHLGAPWRATDRGVLFPNESSGAVELLLVPYDGSTPETLMSGPREVAGVAEANGRIVATVSDSSTWGEVVLRETDRTERRITDFNRAYRESCVIYPMREVTAPAADGYPVHGWLVRPEGEGPHPVLLMIHGGPFAQYGWHLFDEAQVYADAGFAVVMANPRGSSGYGEAHGRAIIGDVGAVSSGDLMAILDHVLDMDDTGALDGDRVGVLGGSHGGFMTTWIAANEGHRFRAAVSERAVNSIDSFIGSSDIGWFFADDLYGPDAVAQRRQSPLTYANDIDIPMLIIHSEQDWRCPIEQAQRLFVALKKRDVTVEMLVFPGEGHDLSRSGLPSHRLARFAAIVEWFDRYLK
jgi:dipeptidyl aminopeptidase/acylaminoacyl peptidase